MILSLNTARLCCACSLLAAAPARPAAFESALPIIGLIKQAIKKVIKAIDLRIQRLQNKTIWLQNAQKEIENALSKAKLNEISGWSQKQQELFRSYYEELKKVKTAIRYYERIRDIAQTQQKLATAYHNAWALFQSDPNFTADELAYMQEVYAGILSESLSNLDQIDLILETFSTSMTDAQRLAMINAAADKVAQNYDDLLRFNRDNTLLSLQRSHARNEVQYLRQLYPENH